MKIVALTDNHGSYSALKKVAKLAKDKKAELIIHCGDITVFGREIDKLMDEVGKLGLPVLILHGNHETATEMRNACTRNKHNVLFMHKMMIEREGVAFIGYGGGGFALTDNNFRKWSQGVAKKLQDMRKKNPKLKVVFMTHGPPYGTKTDMVLDSHVGNKDYLEFATQMKVDLFITGHIHECEGKEETIKGVRIINPGPFGKVFDL